MNSVKSLLFSYLVLFLYARELEDYVNILGGTDSTEEISRGSTLPLFTLPWGFNCWAPETNEGGRWWFHPSDKTFFGIRLTHQPSPWIGDYGNLLFKASIPDLYHPSSASTRPNFFSGYSVNQSFFSPYLFKTQTVPPTKKAFFSPFFFNNTPLSSNIFSEGRISIDFTVSRHGAIIRYAFPRPLKTNIQRNRISVVLNGALNRNGVDDYSSVSTDVEGYTWITGHTVYNAGNYHNSGDLPDNFRHYFVLGIFIGAGDSLLAP